MKKEFEALTKEVLENPDLSLKAKGLFCQLVYLENHAEEKSFDILKEMSKDGGTAFKSALKELKDNMIISREKVNEGGKFKWYTVFYNK